MPTGTSDILAAVERLRAGGVVAFPTETVYGLGADALSERAVARVFALKGRPSNNPLIVHVSGPEMAARVVAPGAFSEDALRLTRALWPGPLSIVLPKAAGVPSIVTGGGPNVAVRCPDHPVTLALLLAFGGPLVGPSANLSGHVSPTTAAHVREAFDQEQALVLEGGACRGGIESTVVSLLSGDARVLRPGLIGAGEIGRILGRQVEVGVSDTGGGADGGADGRAGGALASPGLLSRHYAPRTPAMLLARAELEETLREEPWRSAAVLAFSPLPAEDEDAAGTVHTLLMPAEDVEYAGVLYAALRQADALGVERILIERPSGTSEVWAAVLDRLRRASAE